MRGNIVSRIDRLNVGYIHYQNPRFGFGWITHNESEHAESANVARLIKHATNINTNFFIRLEFFIVLLNY